LAPTARSRILVEGIAVAIRPFRRHGRYEPVLIYEVTLEVDPEIEDRVFRWLEGHVAEMGDLEPIRDARLFRSVDAEVGKAVFVAHYRMDSRRNYQDYLDRHAERMRADGIERFGGRIRPSRRLLEACGTS
jgi:hypothetical protein